MTAPLEALRGSEAVDLLHAWVQARCRGLDARVLMIKGPSLAHHGLRPKRTSSDVDVLVHPDDFVRVSQALATSGWSERPGTFGSNLFTRHSTTLVTQHWPCDVDIHRYYPGFLADKGLVFDELWARRNTMSIARVDCDIPDRLSSILILALHSLRSNAADRRPSAELATMLQATHLSKSDRAELSALAVATGCAQTLSWVLDRLGAETPHDETESAELNEWRRRVASGAAPTYMWLSSLRAGGGSRLGVLRHAVWPSKADLKVMYPHLRDTVSARIQTRLQRIGRGARALPRVVAAIARARQRRTKQRVD